MLAASLDHHTITPQRAPHLAKRVAAEGRIVIAHFSVGAERWQVSLGSIEHFQRARRKRCALRRRRCPADQGEPQAMRLVFVHAGGAIQRLPGSPQAINLVNAGTLSTAA